MRNVYLSFLGLGLYNRETKEYEYKITSYKLNDTLVETNFIQFAEIKILGVNQFDTIIIVCTEKSYNYHFSVLEQQLIKLGASTIVPLIIEEDMSAEGQWMWLEKILDYIGPDDELTIDMTHGYRSIAIVFSTAINFLQQSKKILLKGVYYGAFEKSRELGYTPIIDMKDFYIINEWAEGVSRLVEDADARKMADVAGKTSDFQVGELKDKKVIEAFEELTNTIRNIDINNIAKKAQTALELISQKEKTASVTGKILLNLVIDKFTSLTTDFIPQRGKYDKNYFLIQLEIINLLLEHKLFMQAYTVMREFIGSIGMIPIEGITSMSNGEGRKKRRKADIFLRMIQVEEKKWLFSSDDQKAVDQLRPFYNELVRTGIKQILKSFSYDLIKYRNGFDHAWTNVTYAGKEEIQQKGKECFNTLKEVINLLGKNGLLTNQ